MSEEKKQIYCDRCQSENKPESKFCANCGNQFEPIAAAERSEMSQLQLEQPVITGGEADPYMDVHPGYGQASRYQEQVVEPVRSSNGNVGFSIASMVCGILSIICCCVWFVGLVLGIVAIVLGIISIYNRYEGRGMAIAGIVLGSLCIVLFIVILAVGMTGSFAEYFNDIINE